jgi:hypothetical protein
MTLLACLLAGAVLAADVPQLNDQRTVSVEVGEIRSVIYDALTGAITIKVEARSPGRPVHVYLVLEKDHKAAVESLGQGKRPDKLLASKEKTEDATLEAKVPAKTAFAVLLLTAGGKAEVKLKVTAK